MELTSQGKKHLEKINNTFEIMESKDFHNRNTERKLLKFRYFLVSCGYGQPSMESVADELNKGVDFEKIIPSLHKFSDVTQGMYENKDKPWKIGEDKPKEKDEGMSM